jgi:hypothetical protein
MTTTTNEVVAFQCEETSKMIEQLIVAAYSAAFDLGAWNSAVSDERYEQVIARSICAQETLREFVLARLKEARENQTNDSIKVLTNENGTTATF